MEMLGNGKTNGPSLTFKNRFRYLKSRVRGLKKLARQLNSDKVKIII